MTQSPDPGLTEEQFRQICSYLLIYAYALLAVQITGASLYLASVVIGREPEGILILVLGAFAYSVWFGNDRVTFFRRQLVNNGINGKAGINLPFRQNVIWWSGWCFVEAILSLAVLYHSTKALFGTE